MERGSVDHKFGGGGGFQLASALEVPSIADAVSSLIHHLLQITSYHFDIQER